MSLHTVQGMLNFTPISVKIREGIPDNRNLSHRMILTSQWQRRISLVSCCCVLDR